MDHMLEDPNQNEIEHSDWYCAHRDCSGWVADGPDDNAPCECSCHETEQEAADRAVQLLIDSALGK